MLFECEKCTRMYCLALMKGSYLTADSMTNIKDLEDGDKNGENWIRYIRGVSADFQQLFAVQSAC